MVESSDDWKMNAVRSAKEASRFFSNKGKYERECWVAETYFRRLKIDFSAGELEKGDEPYDVVFRDIKLQIKEAPPEGRKIQLEYKERLHAAEAAKEPADLLREYAPIEFTGKEIFQIAAELATRLSDSNVYGSREAANIDLLIYVNYPKHYEIEPYLGELSSSSFRSVGYISTRFASVIYSASHAPECFKKNVGVVFESAHE